MRRLLNAYELNNGSRLAPVLGVSRATAYNRIKDPGELTVDELRRLSTHGHIPIEEVRAAL
jgi:hypothetical protein